MSFPMALFVTVLLIGSGFFVAAEFSELSLMLAGAPTRHHPLHRGPGLGLQARHLARTRPAPAPVRPAQRAQLRRRVRHRDDRGRVPAHGGRLMLSSPSERFCWAKARGPARSVIRVHSPATRRTSSGAASTALLHVITPAWQIYFVARYILEA
jgi:hypothetical protein